MSTFNVFLYLLLNCVCFNHAMPTFKPLYLTPNTMPLPMTPTNNRPYSKLITADSGWPKAATAPFPRPLQEPSTITSEGSRTAGASQVLEAPFTSTSTPVLAQWLSDAGVTLSPTNSRLVSLLDRIDFDSLERMCRQRTGLTHASNVVRSVLDNQRTANMVNQLQSQVGSMNADAMICSFLGKLGTPQSMFRDLENMLSGIIPLKQNS